MTGRVRVAGTIIRKTVIVAVMDDLTADNLMSLSLE
jgi:hypothetical protein